MRPVGLMEIRQALNDPRFVDLFPEVRHEIDKYLKQPHCGACSVPVARKILNDYPDRVEKYFPGREVLRPKDEIEILAQNQWSVINCHIDELEDKLRAMAAQGRKQLQVARYEDQVTVVLNDLPIIY